MSEEECPFCEPFAADVLSQGERVLVIRDGFPISHGHTLVAPRRHVGSFFALTTEEQQEILATIVSVQDELSHLHAPDGFNVGFNDGAAAGQTVNHCHVHVIPRYLGDVPDPRGGVRWVLPEKAKYW
ncbi:MAG: HIT family protein [Pseudomonadales bacterium]